MFIDLLPELQRKVLLYCCVDDVRNLALTCSAYNNVLKAHLFETLEIPLEEILDFQLPSDQTVLDLRYASTLRIVRGRPGFLSYQENSENETSWKEENVTAYLEEILQHCSLREIQFQCYSSSPASSELEITGDMIDVLSEKCPSLMSLKLDCCDMIDDIISRLGTLTSLTELSLRFCLAMTNMGLKNISELASLKKLDVAMNFQLSDHGFLFLATLSNLEELNISGCHQLTDESLHCISSSMSRLRLLRAAAVWNVTDAGISHLTKLPHLQELHLSGLEMTSIDSLPYITQLANRLKVLDIRRWTKVSASEMLPYLSALRKLEELLLGPNNNNSSTNLLDLSFLFTLPLLRKLDLNFCFLSVEAASHLKSLPLQELAVCIDSDEALLHVSQISSLRKLNIRKQGTRWGFSDIGLSHLKSVPHLEELILRNHNLNQVMMSRIGKISTLSKLCVSGDSSIDDMGLLNIRVLTALRDLDLSGNRLITDRGLKYVSATRSLRRLNIGSCPHISGEGLNHLNRLPLLRVLAVTLGGYRYTDECLKNVKNVKFVHSDYFWTHS